MLATASVYRMKCPAASTPISRSRQKCWAWARWHEVARMYPQVNHVFGDIVKVTPSTKVVGDMAMYHRQPRHDRARAPRSRPGGPRVPQVAWSNFPRGHRPTRGRLPEHLKEDRTEGRKSRVRAALARICRKVDMEEIARRSVGKSAASRDQTEVASYLMYPRCS